MEHMSVKEYLENLDIKPERAFATLMTYFDYEIYKQRDGKLNEKDLEARKMAQILMKRYEIIYNQCDQHESLWRKEQKMVAKLKKRISKLTPNKPLRV